MLYTSIQYHAQMTSFQTIANNMIEYYNYLGSITEKRYFLSVIAGDLVVNHKKIATKAQNLIDLHTNVRCMPYFVCFFYCSVFVETK